MKKVVLLGSTGSMAPARIKVAADLPTKSGWSALAAGTTSSVCSNKPASIGPEARFDHRSCQGLSLHDALGHFGEVSFGPEGLV